MEKIGIKEFWYNYSLTSIHYKQNRNLPQNLNLMAFLNLLFGKLTLHNPPEFNEKIIRVQCSKCSYALAQRKDICQAHLGIIEGLLQNIFLKRIELFNTCDKGTCTISSK